MLSAHSNLFQGKWALKEDNNGFHFLQIKGINESNTIVSLTMRKIMWTGYSTNERLIPAFRHLQSIKPRIPP
uniref:Uncharacterized protein n=1 Tax=Anopheles funestus TaxID=62324 RepID=A0A182S325_ANOFN